MAAKEKRQAIIEAAGQLFLSRRFDCVTLEQVRLKAGVGKGTIYRYFESKEELYAQVMLAGLDELRALLRQESDRAVSPEQKLLAMARTMHGFYRQRHGLHRSLPAEWLWSTVQGKALREEFHKRREGIVGLVASVLRDGRSEGAYRDDVPPEAGARMFLAMMRAGVAGRGCAERERVGPEKVVEVFLGGMRTGVKG